MDIKNIAYRIFRFIGSITLGLAIPFKAIGRENVPDGPVILCADHSHWADPLYVVMAVPRKYHICIMAKKELFKNKIAAWFFNAIGTFPVDRGSNDINAIKMSMRCLKAGKKLLIFPEGTRVDEDGAVDPKSGAIRIAEKLSVPILPIYIPRNKKLFKRTTIVIGEPYKVEKSAEKRDARAYEVLAKDLMNKILLLKKRVPKEIGA